MGLEFSYMVAAAPPRSAPNERPAVLVALEDYQAWGSPTDQIVAVSWRDGAVRGFLCASLGDEIPRSGECFVTKEMASAVPVGERVRVEPADIQEAGEVRLGEPLAGGSGTYGSSPEGREFMEMREELIEKIRRQGIIYIGQSFQVERPGRGGTHNVSATVIDVEPGLVARMSPDTAIRVKGRDFL